MKWRNLAISALLITCSSCSSLLPPLFNPAEEKLLYILQAEKCETPEVVTGVKSPPLFVRAARADSLVASHKIIFNRDEISRGFYQRAAWAATPTSQFTRILQGALLCTGAFSTVTQGLEPSSAELSLATEIQDFRHDDTSPPGVARITVHAELVELEMRSLLASKTFVAEEPLKSENAEAAVLALSKASRRVSKEIADWAAASKTVIGH